MGGTDKGVHTPKIIFKRLREMLQLYREKRKRRLGFA